MGRAVIGSIDLRGAVAVVSMYGLASRTVAQQVDLHKHIAHRLLALGKPFVWGGDWQLSPGEVRYTSMCLRCSDTAGHARQRRLLVVC